METPQKIAFASTCLGVLCGFAGLVAGLYLGVIRPSMGPGWVPTPSQIGTAALAVLLGVAAIGAGLARLFRNMSGKQPATRTSDEWN